MLERSQYAQLTLARLRLFVREPEAIFWVLFFPLILTMVLGWAFRDREPVPETVAILAGGEMQSAAERLARRLATEPLLKVKLIDDRDEARRLLRFGKIALLLEPAEPPGMTLDPQRPEAELARLRVERVLLGGDAVPVELREVHEVGSRYIDWLFPGILGMNVMGTGIWGIGFAIADMRQKNLIRRMIVTPMRRDAFLLSFLGSRMAFLIGEVLAIGGFAFLVLGVPLRGSPITFMAVALLGMLTFACLGVLVVSRARTIEGASGIMNFVIIPMWLLSGVFFSYERFPEAFQPVVRALPLTALNDALRACVLEGAGLGSMWTEILILVAWALVCFAVAMKLFRWE